MIAYRFSRHLWLRAAAAGGRGLFAFVQVVLAFAQIVLAVVLAQIVLAQAAAAQTVIVKGPAPNPWLGPPLGLYANVSLGGLDGISSFGNGTQLNAGSMVFESASGFRFPITSSAFVALQSSTGVPFTGLNTSTYNSSLSYYGTGEVLIGTVVPFGPLPFSISAGGGGALADLHTSIIAGLPTYSASQTVGGFTALGELAVPLAQNIDLTGSFRYMNLGDGTFVTPAGTFRQREQAYIGLIGLEMKIPTSMIPIPLPAFLTSPTVPSP